MRIGFARILLAVICCAAGAAMGADDRGLVGKSAAGNESKIVVGNGGGNSNAESFGGVNGVGASGGGGNAVHGNSVGANQGGSNATGGNNASVNSPASKPVGSDAYANVPISNKGVTRTATTQATGQQGASGSLGDYQRVVIAMGVVLVVIFVSHRVWKKMGSPGSANSSENALQVISKLAISPRQQLMLIRVGKRCVLVGTAGAQMTALTEITDADEVAGLMGKSVPAGEAVSAAEFNEVLTGAQTKFEKEYQGEDEMRATLQQEEASLLDTRNEISGMMSRIRNLSQQFQRKPGGENEA